MTAQEPIPGGEHHTVEDDMATPPFHYSSLWPQFKRDLLAKESETGFNYTYTWMADQFGHFAIGVFASTLLYLLLDVFVRPGFSSTAALTIMLLGVAVAAIKEVLDVKDSWQGAHQPHSLFTQLFDWTDITRNALTATFFMAAGFVVSYFAKVHGSWGLAALLIAAAIAFPVFLYWLKRRMFFQQSGTPYVRRIWAFAGDFNNSEKIVDGVTRFLRNDEERKKHLVITGYPGTGKTTLATMLATEKSCQYQYVRYMTWFSLTEIAACLNKGQKEPAIQQGTIVWSWARSNVSVIDDVAVINATSHNLSSVGSCTGLINPGPEAIAILKSQQTVWVLGAPADISGHIIEQIQEWLGSGNELLTVELEKKPH